MKVYHINPDESTLHGSFSKDNKPIVTIESGDTVQFSTLDALWGLEPYGINGRRRIFEAKDPLRDCGHALCGPVFINGAEPGMTLKVEIKEIRTGSFGWGWGGGFSTEINKELGVDGGDKFQLNWTLDADALIGVSDKGHKIRLRPFMGIMGMPPNEPGLHSTIPPRFCGGNIDCKELIQGSVLYLPIPVKGGLFSVGDGHAAQGDGEVSTQAIECPMEKVELTFTVCPSMILKMPRANTPNGWVTFGLHKDLNQAMMMALEGMLDLMEELYGFERKEAIALASLVVDLRITQVVNDVRGVHAVLPHGALELMAN